ncbi:MAG: hypothetical protein QOF51_1540 [Chloroflexota bacterium]|nr:hypothetical protein [Chloroflexota bacterium]
MVLVRTRPVGAPSPLYLYGSGDGHDGMVAVIRRALGQCRDHWNDLPVVTAAIIGEMTADDVDGACPQWVPSRSQLVQATLQYLVDCSKQTVAVQRRDERLEVLSVQEWTFDDFANGAVVGAGTREDVALPLRDMISVVLDRIERWLPDDGRTDET